MSEYLPGFLWLAVLLAGNAFFVGAEFAVISARRSQIEPRATEGSRAARTTLWAMEHATLMLATSQLGITVCSLLILTVSEPAIHHFLAYPLSGIGLPEGATDVVAFAVALLLVTYLHVVFGEMVPKNLSFSLPDRAALVLAPPLVLVSRVVWPLIWALNAVANGVLRVFRVEPTDEAASTYTREQVAGIVAQSRREGTLGDDGGTLERAFDFTDRLVADVQVPIADMVVLPTPVTPAAVQDAVAAHGHSRFLVVDADGAPAGYLHMKDVMDARPESFDDPVPAKRLRRLITVAHDAELEDALERLRDQGAHLALVVVDDGTPAGILFLEDVLEVLVGEVQDLGV
jgi:CBS domain containing-hemolysin-like protein